MSYFVKEIFYTIQGEGANAGKPAVFVRFAGCNLWSGREQDRQSAICRFCDTDFVDGDVCTAIELADQMERVLESYPFDNYDQLLVVLTGGEPAIQVDKCLINAISARDFATVAIETNGTIALSEKLLTGPGGLGWGINWVTC